MGAQEMNVRWARLEDAQRISDIHLRAWQVGYKGLVSDEVLASMDNPERVRRWEDRLSGSNRTMVVETDQVLGWATLGEDEVAGFYVHPDNWGGGAAARLMEAALESLGERTLHLWVLSGNHRAQRFYAKSGWALSGRRRSHTISDGSELPTVEMVHHR